MGYPGRRSGTYRGTESRQPADRKKYAVVELEKGRRPATTAAVTAGDYSLMRFKLDTGRTHPDPGANCAHLGHRSCGDAPTAAAEARRSSLTGQAPACRCAWGFRPSDQRESAGVFEPPCRRSRKAAGGAAPGLINQPNDLCSASRRSSRRIVRARTDRSHAMAVSTAKPIGKPGSSPCSVPKLQQDRVSACTGPGGEEKAAPTGEPSVVGA